MQRVATKKSDWPEGCVSFRDVETALLKMMEPLKPQINAKFSGKLPVSHWDTPKTGLHRNDAWTPTDRERAASGIVAYLMERLIWPPDKSGNSGLNECVFLVRNGKLVDGPTEKMLHICDPASVFPALPPYPSGDGLEPPKGKLSYFQPDEAKTFRPSAVADFTTFGNNRSYNHPFIDRRRWTVLEEPKMYLAQSGGDRDEPRDAEWEELRELWCEIKPYSGAELVFRVPSGLSGKKWKRASEIARSMEPEMKRIIFQTLPRKGSASDMEVKNYLISLRSVLSEEANENFTHEDLGKMMGVRSLTIKDRISEGTDIRAVRRLYRSLKDYFK